MEQRPLRLGDIVDDYCPRERRITNHAIVALVGDGIRQTRCTTCDAEHVYKGGKAPRRRPGDPVLVPLPVAPEPSQPVRLAAPEPAVTRPVEQAGEPAELAANAAQSAADTEEAPAEDRAPETWITHRQLIRATLPRVEGELPAPRPIPEFTMHQRPQGRGGHRHFGGWGHGQNANGNGNVNGNV